MLSGVNDVLIIITVKIVCQRKLLSESSEHLNNSQSFWIRALICHFAGGKVGCLCLSVLCTPMLKCRSPTQNSKFGTSGNVHDDHKILFYLPRSDCSFITGDFY